MCGYAPGTRFFGAENGLPIGIRSFGASLLNVLSRMSQAMLAACSTAVDCLALSLQLRSGPPALYAQARTAASETRWSGMTTLPRLLEGTPLHGLDQDSGRNDFGACAVAACAQHGIVSVTDWRMHPGDDLSWSRPDLDDSDWAKTSYPVMVFSSPDAGWHWYRATFSAPSDFLSQADTVAGLRQEGSLLGNLTSGERG